MQPLLPHVDPSPSPQNSHHWCEELRENRGHASRLSVHMPMQIGAFGDPGRDPRGWCVSVAYAALVPLQPRCRSSGALHALRWHCSLQSVV